MNRILWNRRPSDGDTGDIDEIVLHEPNTVHIEQMDHQVDGDPPAAGNGRYWMGNFVADSRGRMRFVEQENVGIDWERDESHEDPR